MVVPAVRGAVACPAVPRSAMTVTLDLIVTDFARGMEMADARRPARGPRRPLVGLGSRSSTGALDGADGVTGRASHPLGRGCLGPGRRPCACPNRSRSEVATKPLAGSWCSSAVATCPSHGWRSSWPSAMAVAWAFLSRFCCCFALLKSAIADSPPLHTPGADRRQAYGPALAAPDPLIRIRAGEQGGQGGHGAVCL